MIESHTIDTCPSGDVTLSYRLFGREDHDSPVTKPPVLFVHGLSYFSYDWVNFGTRLCTDRLGCAMDTRGFGDSTFSQAGDYAVTTMADDIGRLLDHLQWSNVILVAHSMGGRGATCFTAAHPARVAGLVLVDWSPDNAPAGSKRVANTVASTPDAFATVDDAMRYFGTDPDSPHGMEQRARFEAYTKPVAGGFAIKRDPFFRDQFRRQIATGEAPKRGVDLWQLVSDVTVPTLVLRGTRSDLFAPETLPKMLQTNARIQAQEIDAGHHIAGDNPEAALAAIRPFINSLEQA